MRTSIDRTSINYWDFARAREVHEYGLRQPLNSMSFDQKNVLALHEAAHAYTNVVLRPYERVVKLTIIRHGDAFGFECAEAN